MPDNQRAFLPIVLQKVLPVEIELIIHGECPVMVVGTEVAGAPPRQDSGVTSRGGTQPSITDDAGRSAGLRGILCGRWPI
ncbi:cation/multidrug efflux pump [Edwardsiella piscicida]|nr:cation/multidrug efflux pump [Edwardsiella piscicida]